MIDKISKGSRVLWFSIILVLLIVVRDLFDIALSKYIFLAVILAFLFISTTDEIIEMLVFMFPLFWGLPATYILLGACILLMIKGKKISAISLIVSSVAFLFQIIASFWISSIDFPFVLQYVLSIFLLFFCIYETHINIDYRKCLNLFMLGCLVLELVIVISTIKDASADWMELFARGFFRFGEVGTEEVGLTVNANTLAFYSCAGICCALTLMNSAKKKWLYFVAIVLLLACGALAVSRTWVIVVFLSLFLYAVHVFHSPRKIFLLSFAIVVVLVALGYIIAKNPQLYEGFMTRFNSQNVETAGNRTILFYEYLVAFFETPRAWVIGTGIQDYTSLLNMEFAIHNATEQIIICLGIPFGVALIFMLAKPVVKLFKSKISLLYWIPIIGIVFFLQSIQFLSPSNLMFPYIIGIFALKFSIQEKERQSDK